MSDTLPLLQRHRLLSVAIALALGGLSGCQLETDSDTGSQGEAVQASGGETETRPTAAESTASLSNDGVNSLAFALDVAAGDAVVGEETGAEPDTGAATPIVIPAAPVVVQPTETQTVEPAAPAAPAAPAEPAEPAPSEAAPIEPAPESAPEPAPEPEPAAAPAGEQTDTEQAGTGTTVEPTPGGATMQEASEESTIGQTFTAPRWEGFEGTVQDGGEILVRWNEDRAARGYNVFRNGEYLLSVFTNEHLDTDTTDGDYYYEVKSFDYAENYEQVGQGLTVKVRGSGREDPNASSGPGVDLDDYELVFSDEFDGSELDLAKWNTSYLWGDELIINSEEQHYVDMENEPDFGYNPFTFDGDALTINSIATPDNLVEKANGQPYLSGVITSYDSFKFTYGYAEARARTPFGQGLWSAFWLLNAYYGDDDPEIDIMEHIGDNQDVAYHTYHYYDDGELRSTESFAVSGIDFTADFHTFAVDWRPGEIIYYIDGIETKRIRDARVSDQEMYVIANTALGGWWPGSPDATTPFPAEYAIDYIRVYQKLTPYDDAPVFSDGAPPTIPFADDVPGGSPNHRPAFEDWPQGYPTR